MKITPKAARALRRQIKEALVAEGFDGKFVDAEAVEEFIDSNIKTIRVGKDELDKKMLMNILGGTIDIEPAEESVETDEVDEDDEMKEGDEDEQVGKTARKSSSLQLTRMKRVDADGYRSSQKVPHIADSRIKRYERDAALGKTVFGDYETNQKFAAGFRLAISEVDRRFKNYAGKDKDLALVTKDGSAVNPTLGGSFLSDQVETDLIEIKREYGVAERLFNVTSSDKNVIRFTVDDDDPTVAWTDENPSAPTATDAKFAPKQLVTNKLFGLNKQSTEIFTKPDANIADKVARKFVRAAMLKKDLAAIAGDGTSTYGSFVGATGALRAVDATIGNISGLHVASGNAYSNITRSDFSNVLALDPIGDPNNFVWLVSPTFWHSVMMEIGYGGATSQHTGTTLGDVQGDRPLMFMGFPVVLDRSGAMPKTEANSQICALFGDFELGARIHNVTGSMAIETSDQRYFDTDQIGIRYREETGINVFGVGDTSDVGSIVGLITAAS